MGGKLFEAHGAERVSTQDLETVLKPSLRQLFSLFGDVAYHFVDYVANKESHGDVDVLVMDQPGLTEKVLGVLHNQNYLTSKNGNVLSFLYQNRYQVDLLFTQPECFDYSKCYFAYNDLGGMLGRMTRKLGLKHGWQGLEYQQYTQDNKNLLATHFLTADHGVTLRVIRP